MTYTTQAAHRIIDDLHCQESRNRDEAAAFRKQEQYIKAAVAEAWADARAQLITELTTSLAEVEQEARLVPEDETGMDVLAQAARVVNDLFPTQGVAFREHFNMAGDLRDFPADDAA